MARWIPRIHQAESIELQKMVASNPHFASSADIGLVRMHGMVYPNGERFTLQRGRLVS
jgi:hypothetical protein